MNCILGCIFTEMIQHGKQMTSTCNQGLNLYFQYKQNFQNQNVRGNCKSTHEE